MNETSHQSHLAHQLIEGLANAGFGHCGLNTMDILSVFARNNSRLLRDFYLVFAGVNEIRRKKNLKKVFILCDECPDSDAKIEYRSQKVSGGYYAEDETLFQNQFEIGKLSILPKKLVRPVTLKDLLLSFKELRLADLWQAEWSSRHRECIPKPVLDLLKKHSWIVFGGVRCVDERYGESHHCYPCLTMSHTQSDIYIEFLRENVIVNPNYQHFAYFKE
jgi:hypothetical protein